MTIFFITQKYRVNLLPSILKVESRVFIHFVNLNIININTTFYLYVILIEVS